MPSLLHQDASAEREANEKGSQVMYSNNPIHDLGNMYGASAVGAVNIYNDASANQRVSSAGVDALAQGGDIYFGSGLYPATTPTQKGLLGHEMNHAVLQQRGESPTGVAQGGFLDWINDFLRTPYRKNRDKVPETEAGGTWKSEEETNDLDESVLVNHYNMPKIVKDSAMENDRLEGLWQNPVFETHTFVPNKEVDDQPAQSLHSYVGLRYTYFDKRFCMYKRVRAKFGFGSKGLSNNFYYQSDMSTETPLKTENVQGLAYEMERMGRETYWLLWNNCNHFTQRSAMAAGASLPAQLHNTRGGPYGAHLNIGEAASVYAGENAKNAADGTRFFQGGASYYGQMSEKFKLLNSFYPMAVTAAKSDGCPLDKNPELLAALTNLDTLSKTFFHNYNNATAEEMTQQKEDFIRDVQAIKAAKDGVLLATAQRTHPRLNFVVLKVMATAETEQHSRYPAIRKFDDMTPQEKEGYMTTVNVETNTLSDLLDEESQNGLGPNSDPKTRKAHVANMDVILYSRGLEHESAWKPIADVLGFSNLPEEISAEDINALSPRLEALWEESKDTPNNNIFLSFDAAKAAKANMPSERTAEYMLVLGLNGCARLKDMITYLALEKIEKGGAPSKEKDRVDAIQNLLATLTRLMRKTRVLFQREYAEYLHEEDLDAVQ